MKTIFTFLITAIIFTSHSQEGIIGGDDPAPEEYPWMCSIILDYPTPGCGASLIRPQWVLTAGHCELSDFGISSEQVLINSLILDLDELETYAELIDIEEFIVHEDYDNVDGWGPDIALIRLAEPSTITPISLAEFSDSDYYEHGDSANVLGWGTTLDGGTSDILMHASCRFFGDDQCAEKYELSAYDPSMYDVNEGANICAGYFEGDDPTGAGAGDSGGPLFFKDADGSFVQVGVVSGGESDITLEDFPGVFTLVPAYIDWIENTIADYELATSLAEENRELLKIINTNQAIQISGLTVEDNYAIRVYNLIGEEIEYFPMVKGVSQFNMETSAFPAGVYMIHVANLTQGNVTVEKNVFN